MSRSCTTSLRYFRRWGSFPEALARIDRERISAEWWSRHDDQIERWRHTSEMCAEALIPERVAPENIVGIYVSSAAPAAAARAVAPDLQVTVNGHMFFFTSIGRSE